MPENVTCVFQTLARAMLTKGEKTFHRPEGYKDVATLRGAVKKRLRILKMHAFFYEMRHSLYVQPMA